MLSPKVDQNFKDKTKLNDSFVLLLFRIDDKDRVYFSAMNIVIKYKETKRKLLNDKTKFTVKYFINLFTIYFSDNSFVTICI